jgi:hypothetical protein
VEHPICTPTAKKWTALAVRIAAITAVRTARLAFGWEKAKTPATTIAKSTRLAPPSIQQGDPPLETNVNLISGY